MNPSLENPRLKRGLTLLEVLAATMIFAMVMTVLIGTSTSAVHHIGLSARRLEANQVADAVLADLEIQMKQGIAPLVEEEEELRDPFVVRVQQTPLLSNPANAVKEPAGALAGAGTEIAEMIGLGLPEVAKHLKQYDIEVSWIEQDGPQHVQRTTFAFDWQTAAAEYSDLFDRKSGNDSGSNGAGDSDGTDGASDPNAPDENGAFGDNLTPGDCLNGHNASERARCQAQQAQSQ